MKKFGILICVALILICVFVFFTSKDKPADLAEPQIADESGMPLPPQNSFTSPAGAEVTVSNIQGGDTVSSPVAFSGTVPADWVFEGIVPIEVRSTTGELITEWFGEATWIDEDGNVIDGDVSFSTNFTFDDTDSRLADGAVIAIKKNVVADTDVADEITFVVDVAGAESGQDEPGSIPDGLSHVEAGMVDYESCVAAGGEVVGASCTTFDGRVFMTDQVDIYTCDDETGLEIVQTEGGIEYSENGQEFIFLPKTVAASGEKYSNGSITFHAKAGEAVVTVFEQVTLSGCQLQS